MIGKPEFDHFRNALRDGESTTKGGIPYLLSTIGEILLQVLVLLKKIQETLEAKP